MFTSKRKSKETPKYGAYKKKIKKNISSRTNEEKLLLSENTFEFSDHTDNSSDEDCENNSVMNSVVNSNSGNKGVADEPPIMTSFKSFPLLTQEMSTNNQDMISLCSKMKSSFSLQGQKSTSGSKFWCQWCNTFLNTMDDLQFHQLSCTDKQHEINQLDDPEVKPVQIVSREPLAHHVLNVDKTKETSTKTEDTLPCTSLLPTAKETHIVGVVNSEETSDLVEDTSTHDPHAEDLDPSNVSSNMDIVGVVNSEETSDLVEDTSTHDPHAEDLDPSNVSSNMDILCVVNSEETSDLVEDTSTHDPYAGDLEPSKVSAIVDLGHNESLMSGDVRAGEETSTLVGRVVTSKEKVVEEEIIPIVFTSDVNFVLDVTVSSHHNDASSDETDNILNNVEVVEEEIIPMILKDVPLCFTIDDDPLYEALRVISLHEQKLKEKEEIIKKVMVVNEEVIDKNRILVNKLNDNEKIRTAVKEELLLSQEKNRQLERKNRELSDVISKKDKTVISQSIGLNKAVERIDALQQSLSFFCDENTKLKMKVRVEPTIPITESSSEANKLNELKEEVVTLINNKFLSLKTHLTKEMESMRSMKASEKPVEYTPVNINQLPHNKQKYGSLRCPSNYPQSKEVSPDETGKTTPLNPLIRPGGSLYSQALSSGEDTEEQIHIFSSSMMRDVSEEEFNSKLNNGTAEIHLYRGKKSHEIRDRVREHLEMTKTDSVIVLGGGNDLPTSRRNPTTPESIAETLIGIGIDCKNANIPVEKIGISSVLPRAEAYMQGRRKKINDLLREKCKVHNFAFIENDNIILSRHIQRDGVHLNRAGTEKLATNFLDVLNKRNVAVVGGDVCSVVSGLEDCSGGLGVSGRREDCPAGDI